MSSSIATYRSLVDACSTTTVLKSQKPWRNHASILPGDESKIWHIIITAMPFTKIRVSALFVALHFMYNRLISNNKRPGSCEDHHKRRELHKN
jgi:hypothetical protein